MRTLFFTAVAFLLVVVAVGFARHWITVDRTTDTLESKSSVKVEVHKERVKEDVAQAKKAVRDLKENIKDRLNQKSIKGVVRSVDPGKGEVVITAEGNEWKVTVTPQTKIKVKSKDNPTLADVQAGMNVLCTYSTKDGRNVCLTLDVLEI